MANVTDVFLSHNWGKDELGRNNHNRVALINKKLKKVGYDTWFDEERMTGDIDKKMSQGIEKAKGVIVFITKRYHEKVQGDKANDNCKLEFSHATRQKNQNMLPVVMEPGMCDTGKWTGPVGMHLGGRMFIDMSGDLKDKHYLNKKMKRMQKELRCMGIQPLSGTFAFKRHFLF